MNKLGLLAIFLASAVGCATSPISSKEAADAPPERLLAFQTKSSANNATLVVTRDTGLAGSACYVSFWINGTLAARLSPAEKAVFYVAPGELILKVGNDPSGQGLCGTMQDEWTQRETLMRPGEYKSFRLSTSTSGKKDIERSE